MTNNGGSSIEDCRLEDNINSSKSKVRSRVSDQKKLNVPVFSDKRGFAALLKKIFQERGLDFSQYREKCLKRRMNVRLRATGADTYLDYMIVLKKAPAEYDRLFDALTINVTDFFRDKSTYRAIEDVVIPELIRSKKKARKRIIRVWSAGCASGEEPYSIAILFHRILGNEFNDFRISIHATDIDEPILEKAKKAEYDARAFSEIDGGVLRSYFNQGQQYTLKEEIRRMVRFKRHDLISDRPLANLDMILCRNVLIYFSRDLQVKLCTKFYQSLNRGGYLTLGKTESLAGEPARLFRPVSIRERIYQKT